MSISIIVNRNQMQTVILKLGYSKCEKIHHVQRTITYVYDMLLNSRQMIINGRQKNRKPGGNILVIAFSNKYKRT